MVRVPGWVMGSAAAASLNDASVLLGEAAKAGSGSGFARFERTWADGDAVRARSGTHAKFEGWGTAAEEEGGGGPLLLHGHGNAGRVL
eukprot:4096445-Pleurochrysis_carterae.AAC.5